MFASTILVLFIFSCVFGQKAGKVDEFNFANCEEWKARIQNFNAGIQQSHNSKAYVIYYGGRFYPFHYPSGKVVQRLPRKNEAQARVEYFRADLSCSNQDSSAEIIGNLTSVR